MARCRRPHAPRYIEGDVTGNVAFGAVGVGRIDLSRPLTATYLNTTNLYAVPSP